MLNRTILALITLLMATSANAASILDSTIPQHSSAEKVTQWCQSYHRFLTSFCHKMGGDDTLCQDASLRHLIMSQGGPKATCKVVPKQQVLSCITHDDFYLSSCPVFPDHMIQSHVTIHNLDSHSIDKLLRKQSLHPSNHRHVLLIGLDGARPDATELAYQELEKQGRLKNLTRFITQFGFDTHYYAGGTLHTPTQQRTLSEPGWTSILTGVWTNQDHLTKNGDIAAGKYNHHIPTIYNTIKLKFPDDVTAAYSDWKPMNILATYHYKTASGADINQLFSPSGANGNVLADKTMTQQIAHVLQAKSPPQFIFIHYNDPDATGHRKRFSAKSKSYVNAIQREFSNADQLIKVINKQKNQQWLVIITTDHGGHQFSHGTQLKADRHIFAVMGAIHGIFDKVTGPENQTTFVHVISTYLSGD